MSLVANLQAMSEVDVGRLHSCILNQSLLSICVTEPGSVVLSTCNGILSVLMAPALALEPLELD
jgi:hypothetical protein